MVNGFLLYEVLVEEGVIMFLLFLSHFPVIVLETLAAALLVIATGMMVALFSALYSKVACKRVIRLVHAVADALRRHDVQSARSKRRVRND